MSIELITGPMFSGKTTKLFNDLNNASRTLRVLYIKPKKDVRTPVSHNEFISLREKVSCISADSLSQIVDSEVGKYEIVGIDEAQWFSDLVGCVLHWSETLKLSVLVCGLTLDYKRDLFGEVHKLMCHANIVHKMSSYCETCKTRGEKTPNQTVYSFRYDKKNNQQSLCGGSTDYTSVCRECWVFLNNTKRVNLRYKAFI